MLVIALLFFTWYASAMSDEIWQAIADHTINGQKEFAIVVPTYNNATRDICIKNIISLLDQVYENYHIYIVDDCSTDNTFILLHNFLKSHPRRRKVTLIKNGHHVGALANYYGIISTLPDHVIVLNVDGDDWLAHDHVLRVLNRAYDKNIWMTYGQFKEYPSDLRGFCKPISKEVIKNNSYRHSLWLSSHPRSYYAWLFKKIDVQDFYYNGQFMKACADRAIMYPLLEMAGGRFLCSNKILYCYNCTNPLADIRAHLSQQREACHYICALKPYKPLNSPIFNIRKGEKRCAKR